MALLIPIMYGLHLRIYSTVILNAGHYKQTQINAITEATTNIVVSLIFVGKLGIIGVAIGTMIAMLVRTIMDVLYLSKNIVYRSPMLFVKCLISNIIIFITSSLLSSLVQIQMTDWMSWICKAIISMLITIAIALIIYRIVYPEQLKSLVGRVKRIISI